MFHSTEVFTCSEEEINKFLEENGFDGHVEFNMGGVYIPDRRRRAAKRLIANVIGVEAVSLYSADTDQNFPWDVLIVPRKKNCYDDEE